jgi:putative peptidoglycan lipid II flippase
LAGYAGIKIVVPAFYALGDVRTPVRISLISIAVNYAMNWTLVRALGFGHLGLALSTSTVATVNFFWLSLVLRRRLGGLEGRRLARSLPRIGAAAVVMGLVVHQMDALLTGVFSDPTALLFLGSGALAHAGRVAVGIVLGVGLFCGLSWLLGLRLPVLSWWRGRPPAEEP